MGFDLVGFVLWFFFVLELTSPQTQRLRPANPADSGPGCPAPLHAQGPVSLSPGYPDQPSNQGPAAGGCSGQWQNGGPPPDWRPRASPPPCLSHGAGKPRPRVVPTRSPRGTAAEAEVTAVHFIDLSGHHPCSFFVQTSGEPVQAYIFRYRHHDLSHTGQKGTGLPWLLQAQALSHKREGRQATFQVRQQVL